LSNFTCTYSITNNTFANRISGPLDEPQYANPCYSSLYMHETPEEEVSRLTENLSDNKAIQHGDIQTKFITLSKSMLAPFLTPGMGN